MDSIRKGANHELQPDSVDYLAPPDTVSVNGVKALRLQPFCGDCAPEEVYLAGRTHTVVLSYVFDIGFPGDRRAQGRLYTAIMSTFMWKR